MTTWAKSLAASITLVVSVGAVILAMAYSGKNNLAVREEQTGRAIVMAARGWESWPTEPALPACEWDPTGNFHLVVPCEDETGLIYFRNLWIPKRWKPWQRSEL